MTQTPCPHSTGPGFLARLRRDRAGNTLAVMAIALIPLLGFVGSAVDTARLYVVKVRLQQACDAGVLAGRKFMNATGTTLDANATLQANNFFNNNFKSGTFGSSAVSFTPSRTTDNQVAGTASVTVPMTLTKMMGFGDNRITVTCEARYDVADVDIMFVLDTTASMAYTATDTDLSGQPILSYTRSDGSTGYYASEKTDARIKALRTAVLNFYDTLASTADPTTNIRYGFVPYTSTVNVGYQIPSSYLVSGSYTYQTRTLLGDGIYATATTNYKNSTRNDCYARASGRSPAIGYDANDRAYITNVEFKSDTNTCVAVQQTLWPYWRYGPASVDVSRYVAGNTVKDPSKIDGSTSKWQGCIEERDTAAQSSFSQSALPPDLDPDLLPTNDASKWRPMWPDLVYYRGNNQNGIDTLGNYESVGSEDRLKKGFVSCGKSAQRLATMTRAQVSAFLNAPDFRPQGGTYHDVGMIWGTRFINPNGAFASDTSAWPGRNPPIRHIVFMTDGGMSPNQDIYGLYGLERYDRRVGGGDASTLTARHNARFLAECEAAKRRGITVWTIAFGDDLTPELQQCASTAGNAFEATSNAALNTAFQTIAARVAMLRISK